MYIFNIFDQVYCFDKGVLCIRWISNISEERKICLSRKLRQVVLWHLHDFTVYGHMGINKNYGESQNSDFFSHAMVRQFVHGYTKANAVWVFTASLRGVKWITL